ncbi:hypothetical protein SUDANB126_00664 [Streptomyces sp. enrichment culture]
MLDFELEAGAVIGRSGRDLTPEEAREHIVGYLVFNDWSARDLHKPEKNLGLGFSEGKASPTRWARTWSPPTRWRTGGTRTASSTWR